MSARDWNQVHRGRAATANRPLLVVVCGVTRLIEVTREEQPRVISTGGGTVSFYFIDVQGLFTLVSYDGEAPHRWYENRPLYVSCKRHRGHSIGTALLVKAWEGSDPERKSTNQMQVRDLEQERVV